MSTTNQQTASALTITRTFRAPREMVFRAWTEPERAAEWWGPTGFTTPVCEMDPRPGGKYRNCMKSPDGQEFWSVGTYREVVPPERIVCTDSFADPDGNVVPATYYGMGAELPLETLVTVTFEESGGGALMTLRHDGLPPGDYTEMCEAGWSLSFDRLADYLEAASS